MHRTIEVTEEIRQMATGTNKRRPQIEKKEEKLHLNEQKMDRQTETQ